MCAVCGKSADLSDIQYVRDALHAVFSGARLSREWRVLRRWAASRYKGQERSYEYTVYQKTLLFQHPYVVEEDMRGQTSSSWEFSAT